MWSKCDQDLQNSDTTTTDVRCGDNGDKGGEVGCHRNENATVHSKMDVGRVTQLDRIRNEQLEGQ